MTSEPFIVHTAQPLELLDSLIIYIKGGGINIGI